MDFPLTSKAALAAVMTGVLLLCSCASQRGYVAPSGIPIAELEADQRACAEESGIERLGDDQVNWEQQCMMARGYTIKP